MRISAINDYYQNICSNNNTKIKPNYSQSFYGLKFKPHYFKDTLHIPPRYVEKLQKIQAGEFGTICKGSIPMQKFFPKLKSLKEIETAKRNGLSTNDIGYAYSFLKAQANRPLSTSFIHDCTAMYLYNEKTNTHFLYHIFKDENKKEISEIIKLFMPEGYTHASLVPGDKHWSNTHKKYLPEVFSAIKNGSKNVKISIYHDSSPKPEVVGYMGKMYEIPNKYYLKPYTKRICKPDKGQASFPIRDFRIYSTIYKANESNDIIELFKNKLKIKISNTYTNELKKILYKVIDERINGLKELKKIQTPEELNTFLKTKDMDYIFGYPQIGKAGYHSAIDNKKIELGIK